MHPHLFFSNYSFPYQIPRPSHQPMFLQQSTHLEAMNQEFQKKYEELLQEHQQLLEKYRELEEVVFHAFQKVHTKKRSKRRPEEELQRTHHCPYPRCQKDYASDFALNLHIKNKHGGGNKRQRDQAAKTIIKYESVGLKPPKQSIKLPPGYIEENRVRLTLMDSPEELQAGVKSEEDQ